MAWTREEAIEWGRKGARKGGLARAARLSAARRLDIAMLPMQPGGVTDRPNCSGLTASSIS